MSVPSRLPIFVPVLVAGLACASAPLRAAPTHPVLVELFTSQGCSSCPAADEFVADLPRLGLGRDRVVPLTFHVDYWDDLGWKDPFASPSFTERQRAYVRSGWLSSPGGEDGISGAYTPQMVVGGRVHFSGRRRDVAQNEIQRAATTPEPASLSARAVVDGNAIDVTSAVTAADHTVHRDWRLFVVLAQKHARTAVAHGENAGETLTEAAVARWLSPAVALPADGAPLKVVAPKLRDVPPAEVEVVVFVQAQSTGQIVCVRSLALGSL
jgi:hypothetical protein